MLRRFLSNTTVTVTGLMLLAGFIAFKLSSPLELLEFREQTFDTYARIKPRDYNPADDVRIVDIDERSLKSLGQWPWPRTLIADLFDALVDYNVRVVGFDGVFPEYDRSSPVEIVSNYSSSLTTDVRDELLSLPRTELAMARSMKNLPVVMGLIGVNSGEGDFRFFDPDASSVRSWFEPFPSQYLTFFRSLKGSVPEIQQEAAGSGVFSLLLGERTYRRAPLVVNVADRYIYPSLTLEMLRVGLGSTSISLNNPGNIINGVTIHQPTDRTIIPTDRFGQVRIYFTSQHQYNVEASDTSRFISAIDIIERNLPLDALEDAYVLIGSSSSGLKDLRSTPLSPALPGVAIHANLLENLLGRHYLVEPADTLAYEFYALLFGGLLLVGLSGARLYLISLLTVTGLIAANFGISWHLFSTMRTLYDPVYGSICFFMLFTTGLMLTYIREIREKSYIRRAFQQYLSPELVQQLTRSEKKLVLGGESRILTILFCDIRGFTAISESLKEQPQLLTSVVNSFLTPLSNIIIAQKGTIDKYIGDCVMAFWNAPLDIKDHASLAIKAALQMRLALVKVNDEINVTHATPKKIEIAAGIGINTGQVVVGNMGSQIRFDYSVLGDPVNLAARLESQTRMYHVDIIFGEETFKKLPENLFHCLELDTISVQGKKEQVRIYTALGEVGHIPQQAWSAFNELHSQFLRLYRRQNWHEAIHHLRQAQRIGPNDLFDYYDAMQRRIAQFKVNPPPPDWDGVYVATSK